MLMFNVVFKRKVEKSVEKMPELQAVKFHKLIKDLEEKGPALPEWPNYGKIKGTNTHHCHLSRKWVACWAETEQGIEIEVTYAGSRENSPYA